MYLNVLTKGKENIGVLGLYMNPLLKSRNFHLTIYLNKIIKTIDFEWNDGNMSRMVLTSQWCEQESSVKPPTKTATPWMENPGRAVAMHIADIFNLKESLQDHIAWTT